MTHNTNQRLKSRLLSMIEHMIIFLLLQLNLFELLLSTSVKSINIQSIRPFFRQALVSILDQHGDRLEHLNLEDHSWLELRHSLAPTLARMTFLRHVSLHYLANDAMVTLVLYSHYSVESSWLSFND